MHEKGLLMKYILLILLTLSVTLSAYQYHEHDREFTSVVHIQDYSQTVAIGNTVLCEKNNGNCVESTVANNRVDLEYIDNSSADLTSPFTNYDVQWAGLFWQGRGYIKSNATDALNDLDNADKIKIKFPDDANSRTITLKTNDFIDGHSRTTGDDNFNTYSAYTDITDTLQTYIDAGNNPLGTYTVTDLYTESGDSPDGLGFYGAWTLVVVFKDTTRVAPLRDINVFNGYVAVGDSEADINIEGFITTQDTSKPVESSIFVFSAEGDRFISGDQLLLKAGTSDASTPDSAFTQIVYPGGSDTNVFNSSISGSFNRSPSLTNNNAIDLHQIEVGDNGAGYDIIGHDEYQAAIRLKTDGDHYYPSMVIFEADILAPKFCYDYAYSQNDRYFTEDNPGTNPPRLVGSILPGADVNMTIYVRNEDDSDVKAINLEVNVTNIDTTQATYERETTRVTQPLNYSSVAVPDANLVVSDSAIRSIDIDDVDGQEQFYIDYTLDTSNLVGNDINMSIDVQLAYDLVLPTPDGGEVVVPSITKLGGLKVPMCSQSGLKYIPDYGRYNIEHNSLYASQKYNLPTQVAKRPDAFKLVSYNPDDYDDRNITNSTVFVELIDGGGHADIQAACNKDSNSISERIFVGFKGTEFVDFDRNLILANSLDATKTENDFFGEARENVLFRISYNVLNDENASLVDSEWIPGTGWVIHNFTALAQGVVNANLNLPPQDQNKCRDDVVYKSLLPNGNIKTEVFTTMPQACGNNAASNGMTDIEMAICMECVFGYNTRNVCSRDNFSARPEAFNIDIYDNDESTSKASPEILVPKIADISAGYLYSYEINATTHEGNAAVVGYTKDYRLPTLDYNLSYNWDPAVGKDVSGCNDIFPKHPAVYIQNGFGINDPNIANINDTVQNKSKNVGRYRLNMIDSDWTAADQNPYHHSLVTATRDYSNDFTQGDDCAVDDNRVPSNLTPLALVTDATGNLVWNVGCNISSDHTNLDAGITYIDHDITIHPYAFDISNILFQKGTFDLNNTALSLNLDENNSYVYQNNITRATDDINMSARFTGLLRPVGADRNTSVQLSNFVDRCYSQNLNLDVITDGIPTVNAPEFQYRLRLKDSSGLEIIDDNNSGGNDDISPRATTMAGLIVLPSTDFNVTMDGDAEIELNVNFGRDVNISYNPITLTYSDFNISCSTLTDCQSRVDMELTHDANGSYSAYNPNYKAAPLSIVHLYGREHVPRQRVQGPNAAVVINYEFFCDSDVNANPAPCNIQNFVVLPSISNSISPVGLLSPDDVRWYMQAEHNTSVDGNATFTTARTNADLARFANGNNMQVDPITRRNATYVYDGAQGYPYKVTVEINTPDWLIYSRYDGSPTVNVPGGINVNNFELEFTQVGNWAGKNKSGMEVDSNAAGVTNRRIKW